MEDFILPLVAIVVVVVVILHPPAEDRQCKPPTLKPVKKEDIEESPKIDMTEVQEPVISFVETVKNNRKRFSFEEGGWVSQRFLDLLNRKALCSEQRGYTLKDLHNGEEFIILITHERGITNPLWDFKIAGLDHCVSDDEKRYIHEQLILPFFERKYTRRHEVLSRRKISLERRRLKKLYSEKR